MATVKATKEQKAKVLEYATSKDSANHTLAYVMGEGLGITKEWVMVEAVYLLLKDRDINPKGKFDKAGRWYAENSDLISVREPSRAYPFSQMVACRTRKYVQAVYEKFKSQINSIEDLKSHV